MKNNSFRKIPILITKWNDGNVKGWRAEIADSYDNYKTSKFNDINFEDIGFHFNHSVDTHENDCYVFYLRKDAVKAAKEVNEKYLNNKAKIWFNDKSINSVNTDFKLGDWAAYNWLDDEGNDNWKVGRIVNTNNGLMYYNDDGTNRCGYMPITKGVKLLSNK